MTGTGTTTGAADPAIRIRGLCKAFGDNRVLDGLDLDIARGESLAVIGGSGIGKSVLVKNIVGLMRPDSGSIEIDGTETVGLAGAARDKIFARFGVLFQGAALFDSMSIWENVAFSLIHNRGMPKAEAREAAIVKLAQVGLGRVQADRYPADLSAGMQKRVGLARAIAAEPQVLFFDEPTTGLGPIMGEVINDLIVECVRGLGATALTITHDMASARKIADRIAMIHDGRIVWAGPAVDIDESGNAAVDQFIHGRTEGPIRTATRAA